MRSTECHVHAACSLTFTLRKIGFLTTVVLFPITPYEELAKTPEILVKSKNEPFMRDSKVRANIQISTAI